ncbi:phosphate/phosphite/phosphonate ABC transporter substrate-binding protein [Magnetospirillum sulfuroxidans]|uniref:Phosphate/phosphite/phosphonate ABC transporter substrate-binding protein n=1 Tax=Magnetospirillum sulfuroxidans TaxID=611300 RepID=A0ABS5IC64_9PROT|nr:phosphate/phosphite/phosphonate ABC transporter substrate-binding protein [Magnetospirillum sulfuroxidans]MBR9971757.1 phosphate/phosphite/phosphonate ABC transporter substrate-binding protein [Magnetospirillum sulfuroxidans]
MLALVWAGRVHAEEGLVVGITPQQSASRLAESWVPLLEEAGRRFGASLTFRTAPDIKEFERRVLAGEYDVIYGSPVLYVAAAQALGARAIARQRQDEQGVLVVRGDSPVRSIQDLHGRKVAFPAASALGATVLNRASLLRGDVDVQEMTLSSDESVYRAVLDGIADAGGGAVRTLTRQGMDVRAFLRVVLITEAFPAYPIFVLPRIGQARAAHLQAVLFSLDGDDAGKAVLARAALLGVALADDHTYDPIRSLSGNAVETLLKGAAP